MFKLAEYNFINITPSLIEKRTIQNFKIQIVRPLYTLYLDKLSFTKNIYIHKNILQKHYIFFFNAINIMCKYTLNIIFYRNIL